MRPDQYFNRGLEIVRLLKSFTFDAYIVGGAVRDYIMHREFVDIDIATSATPDQVLKLFPNARGEYKDLGFVLLKEDDVVFEISTFKIEIYENTRKPSQIYYATDLSQDLKRRDFTVNALALTDKCQVVDLVGGVRDLKWHTIRAIGNPVERFKEDPLRIFRAYSLMARFNFRMDYRTMRGVIKSNYLVNSISNFQLSRELSKILNAKYATKALKAMKRYYTLGYLSDYQIGLKILRHAYKQFNEVERLALCFATNGIPENTCFDKATLGKIRKILDIVEKTSGITRKEKNPITKKDIFDYGVEDLLSAVKINSYLQPNYPTLENKIIRMSKHMVIRQMSELKFHGSDLVNLRSQMDPTFIKKIMEELASEVVLEMIPNEYRQLKERAIVLLSGLDQPKPKPSPINEVKEEYQDESMVSTPSALSAEMVRETKNIQSEVPLAEFEETPLPKRGDDTLIGLKVHYDLEFNEHVKNALAAYTTGNETEEELASIKATVEKSVKQALLSQNPEYHQLEQKGLI